MAASPDPKAKSTGLMNGAFCMLSLGLVVLAGLFDDAPTTFLRLGLGVVVLTCATALGMVYHAKCIASESWPESPGSATSS